MIIGAHTIINSVDPEADRAFFRDVLRFPNIDLGGGWLVFGLPPAEVAFHPSEANDSVEFYLMVRDIEEFISLMEEHQVACSTIQEEGWGRLVRITLPGGGNLDVYQPLHESPPAVPG